MDHQNELDFNDLMFDLNEELPPGPPTISSDSNFPSSISGVGVDADNSEENDNYIEENQERQEVILAVGLENVHIVGTIQNDSGLGTSISKTRSSEPGIEKTDTSTAGSGDREDEDPPGPSNEHDNDVEYDENQRPEDNIPDDDNSDDEENCISAFDLALEKGYRDQAKLYHDAAEEQGLPVQTRHIRKLKEMLLKKEDISLILNRKNPEILEEDFWTSTYTIQKIKMLEMDFQTYLECIKKNQFKKVLEIINRKIKTKSDRVGSGINTTEQQIKNNLKSKDKRCALKNQTIDLINKDIMLFRSLMQQIHNDCNKSQKTKLYKKIDIYNKILEIENLPLDKREAFVNKLAITQKQLKLIDSSISTSASEINNELSEEAIEIEIRFKQLIEGGS